MRRGALILGAGAVAVIAVWVLAAVWSGLFGGY